MYIVHITPINGSVKCILYTLHNILIKDKLTDTEHGFKYAYVSVTFSTGTRELFWVHTTVQVQLADENELWMPHTYFLENLQTLQLKFLRYRWQ